MFGRFENRAAIGALAFEDRAAIMHGVGQHVNLRVAPGQQSAVHPDQTVAIVESLTRHGILPGLEFGCARRKCASHHR
jgi:hypothetical protein